MTKRLVDIDDELLEAARGAAGESSIKGTVRAGLEGLVSARRRREDELRARWDALGDTLQDLHDEDVMRRAWS